MSEGNIKILIREAGKWIAGLHIHCWHRIEDFKEIFINYPYHGRKVTATRSRPQWKCCKCPKTKLDVYLISDVV